MADPISDPIFGDRRLAALYDVFDDDRSDLDHYAAIVEELGAGSVLDVGCGTGTFACLLAGHGIEVVGVDPARASVEIASSKPGADRVTWLVGDATALPPLQVDVAVMTANVAQVFLTDEEWTATLLGVRAALRPGGWLVFETRRPEAQAWREWTPALTRARRDVPDVGVVETWCRVTDVTPPITGPLVTFRWTTHFPDGDEVVSDSTLRFRSRAEVTTSLAAVGFVVTEIRQAPDRPGQELVFLAHR